MFDHRQAFDAVVIIGGRGRGRIGPDLVDMGDRNMVDISDATQRTPVQISGGVIDGDGHIREDMAAIAGYVGDPYRKPFSQGKMRVAFPPLDHFHGTPVEVRGGTRGTVGPPEWLAFLQEVGIESTVLYPTMALAVGKIRDVLWAKTLTGAYNDWLKATYLDFSDRFKAMAIIPMQDPAAAVRELERAVDGLGFQGGMLPSHGLPNHLGSKCYWPVYEAAEDLNCAIAVHGGCHDGFGFDDMNVYAPVHALGHPAGQLVSLAGMVFNGVFDRFPRLRVAYLEGGVAWILMALERFDESEETHVAFDEEGPALNGRDVAAYILDLIADGHIFFGCEGGERDLPYVIDTIGAGAFMYSSDFPHEVTTESCLEEMSGLTSGQLSVAATEGILRANAQRFYRLS